MEGTKNTDGLSCRHAFTLVELLVTITIVATLLGLTASGVIRARQSARRAWCQNNLRQVGVAILSYETVQGDLPSPGVLNQIADTGAHSISRGQCETNEIEVEDNPGDCTEFQSWTVGLLPFLNEMALSNRYQTSKPWSDLVNRSAISNQLKVFLCPSAGDVDRYDVHHVLGAAASDYGAIHEVEREVFTDVLGVQDPGLRARQGVIGATDSNTTRMVVDGLSHTLMLAESGGKPTAYIVGKPISQLQFHELDGATGDVIQCGSRYVVGEGTGWADPDSGLEIEGASKDGMQSVGPRMINATNEGEVYSLHPGGAHGLVADGSVRFLPTETDTWLFVTVCTRAGEEAINLW